MDIVEQLKRDEGFRNRPYQDTKGKTTIGYGRNLQDVGITESEAEYLLDNDIQRATNDVIQRLPWTRTLDPVRAGVLINMAFNMGIGKVLEFRHMLEALKAGNFGAAANEMENSAWYHQVGDRAKRLVSQMISGAWQ